jgi:replicative DNA helicase
VQEITERELSQNTQTKRLLMRKITEDFLLEIFSISLKDANYFKAIREHLKTNFILDEDYRRTWEIINQYYKEKKVRPTYGALFQRLADSNVKGKNEGVMAVLGEVKTTIVNNPTNIISEFSEFIKQNKFMELYASTGKLFNDNQKEKAYDEFIIGAEQLAKFNLASATFGTVFGDFFMRQADRLAGCNNGPVTIPFMMPEFDEATDGGARTGETELWLGDSGMGKSKLLVGRGIASARTGNAVLHVQAEGTERQCYDNYDACWTGQLYKDFKSGNINMNKMKAYAGVIKGIGADVYVKAFEQFGTVRMGMIVKWVEELLQSGVNLRHVIIDYMDLIEPEMEFGNTLGSGSERERLKQMEVVRQLKSLATTYNVLVTTATQSSDIPFEFSEDEKNTLTRNHLGNARRKVEPFSYFFTINQSPRERRAQQVRVKADKLRDHDSGQVWRIKQSLKNSRFYDRKGTLELAMEDEEDELNEEIIKEKKGKRSA